MRGIYVSLFFRIQEFGPYFSRLQAVAKSDFVAVNLVIWMMVVETNTDVQAALTYDLEYLSQALRNNS